MTTVLQSLGATLIIAALLALSALVLYIIWWMAMIVVSLVPIAGRKHRHPGWERLNRRDEQRPAGDGRAE